MIYVQLSEKLLPLKRRKVVLEEENSKKKWQGRYLKQGHWMRKFIEKTNSRVRLSENDSAAIADADQSTNISTENEIVYVIMNKSIDEVCDEIESN